MIITTPTPTTTTTTIPTGARARAIAPRIPRSRSLSAHLTRRALGVAFNLLRFQGRRWPCGWGIVGRGGRTRVALPRRPRAPLPRAHLLPRRLHQARAAARLARLR
ncbi:Urease accessory protein G [Zea mays]|uniref:Urease accessory protein G n=1 Tax=Zea mays TaxID=4577 RepID=A0A1D6FKC6_MAIZE|nr:Urease accessory protein G [Zea mays]